MAYKLVSNVRDSVSGILTGINLNNVQNLNGAFERSARELSTKIYIPEVSADRKSTRLNSSHIQKSRMPSSA